MVDKYSDLLGNYSDGGHRVKARGYQFVAYDDCQTCEGRGYLDPKAGYYYTRWAEQCPDCAIRNGVQSAIKERAIQLQNEAKRAVAIAGLKIGAKGKLTPEAFAFCEDYNCNSEVAKEYRYLLRKSWAEKPIYTPIGE